MLYHWATGTHQYKYTIHDWCIKLIKSDSKGIYSVTNTIKHKQNMILLLNVFVLFSRINI